MKRKQKPMVNEITYPAPGQIGQAVLTSTAAAVTSGPITISLANPAVISTPTANSLSAGNIVTFQTTGALPAHILPGVPYYVISGGLTTAHFEISTTSGGTAVNTSADTTQYGIHSYSVLTPITIATSETTLVTIIYGIHFKRSQLTMYYDVTFGLATSVKFRYYYSPDNGATYYQVPIKSTSTGILADLPSIIDSTSPVQGNNIRVVEDLPFSGATTFKITGTAVGASAQLNRLEVYGRDN
jgi:hypothetical protein